ncbi:hypothetical protein, partial [Klebsiella pneumoniae]
EARLREMDVRDRGLLGEEAQRRAALDNHTERLAELESRWAEEKQLVDELLATRARLRESVGVVDQDSDSDHQSLRAQLV